MLQKPVPHRPGRTNIGHLEVGGIRGDAAKDLGEQGSHVKARVVAHVNVALRVQVTNYLRGNREDGRGLA